MSFLSFRSGHGAAVQKMPQNAVNEEPLPL